MLTKDPKEPLKLILLKRKGKSKQNFFSELIRNEVKRISIKMQIKERKKKLSLLEFFFSASRQ